MAANESFALPPHKGMIVRSRDILEPGLTLFKLGHRFIGRWRSTDADIVCSPWWVSAGAMEEMGHSAARAGDTLAGTFRRFAAIAKRWGGSGDLIVKVRLAEPLVAYIGPGTVQDFRGVPAQRLANETDMPLWVPSPNIAQIFMPLIVRDDSGTPVRSVAPQCFRDIFLVRIDAWEDRFVHSAPPSQWSLQ